MKTSVLSKCIVIGVSCLSILGACGQSSGGNEGQNINVVSREEGSGTRGAFVELFKVEDEDKNDVTTEQAIVTNSTAIMLTTVAGDANAIGYASLGSLDDTVKTVAIDGAEASVDNIKNETYKMSRPFNIVSGEKQSPAGQDFINFILSVEGQEVVKDTGYISLEGQTSYKSSVDSGKVVISGSSSVTPVMEKLKEAYLTYNPDVTIEIQQSDSSTGVTNVIEGAADIGMVSRELKDSELEKGVKSQVIAMDGIAIIVNQSNTIEELSSDQIKAIFTGEASSWEQLLSE